MHNNTLNNVTNLKILKLATKNKQNIPNHLINDTNKHIPNQKHLFI